MRIHEMLEKFFQCEFNIFEFRRKHETELRDLAINQYANTASISELAQDVDDMLRIHKMTKKINIAKGFPQKILVETMRPFLKIYLLERYSFSSMTRKYYSSHLNIELHNFAEKNPTYGKRIKPEFVAPPNSNPFSPTQQYVKQPETYTTETIPHNSYCKSNYMKTHIYDEDTFDRYIETGDSMKTYMEPYLYGTHTPPSNEPEPEIETEEEWNEPPIYTFSPPSILINQINRISNIQLNSAAMYAETPAVTVDQIQANTRAILTRIGRLPSVSSYMGVPEEHNQNNIYINNNIIHNTHTNNIINEEEEEEEDEEVIQNPNNEYDSDSYSYTEWANEIMEDGEDSVS
jgi:hypothetical protein